MLVYVAQSLLWLADSDADIINWFWAKGHSNSPGNDEAGELATKGGRGTISTKHGNHNNCPDLRHTENTDGNLSIAITWSPFESPQSARKLQRQRAPPDGITVKTLQAHQRAALIKLAHWLKSSGQ